MERAHVVIRLRGDALEPHEEQASPRKLDGVTRTSATTVRLEHSDMSPGVASITFEQVFDQQHSSAHVFEQSLAPAVARSVQGYSASVVLAGAPRSGKSFTCHGDKQLQATGVITLALRGVFRELERQREMEPAVESQVLLACFYARADSDALSDAMQSPAATVAAPASPLCSTAPTLLTHAVAVANSAQAVHLYTQALAQSAGATDGASDFALVVFIETKRPSESRARRGRFVVLDVHGSSIVESVRWQDGDAAAVAPSPEPASRSSTPLFSDTHFPIATVLSRWFGGFVANASATYVLVTIHKHAQFQQQAIQSLLYACKAKDMKSECAITYIAGLTRQPIVRAAQAGDRAADEDGACSGSKHDESVVSSASASAASTDSTDEFAVAANGMQCERQLPVAAAAAVESVDPPSKHAIFSQRLRQAYESAKSSHPSPNSSSSSTSDPLPETRSRINAVATRSTTPDRFDGLFATKASLLHAKADAILSSASATGGSVEALSLLDKLERIHAQQQSLGQALAHETSVKAKCVDRIAKLSQTMSFQVIEHAKQLEAVVVDKARVEAQLEATVRQFEDVSAEVAQLQLHVRRMKALSLLDNNNSSSSSSAKSCPAAPAWSTEAPTDDPDHDRAALLQQFALRLETAMDEAKAVVAYKDSVIRDLERRVDADAAAASARMTDALAQLTHTHEVETAALRRQIDALEHELREKEQTLADTEQTQSALRTALAATELERLLATKTREWVAAHAARAASCRTAAQLEARVATLAAKMARRKSKMALKMKAVVRDRTARVSELLQQLDAAREREQEHRDDLARRERDAVSLETECARLQRALEALATELESAQAECRALEAERHAAARAREEQIHALEQTHARQLLAREAQLAAEHTRALERMMERHAAELTARDSAFESVKSVTRSSSSRSLARTGSSASPDAADAAPLRGDRAPPQQQSLDDLDALLDGHKSQDTRVRKTPRKSAASASIAALERKVDALTQALAVANEQETRAKAHVQSLVDANDASAAERERLLRDVNRLKHENWSLSLALQVTERPRRA